LQIQSTDKIYSKILADPKNNVTDSLNKLSDSFSDDNNKLNPIKKISLELFEDKNADELLRKISKFDKIKEYSSYSVPIISVAVTSIALILKLIYNK